MTDNAIQQDLPQVRMLTSYVLFVIVAALLLVGFVTPAFRVSTVRVTGKDVPVARVAQGSEVLGKSIFTIRGSSVVDDLQQVPNVLVTSVDIALPNTVVIHTALRPPVLAWKQRNSVFLVDRYGRVIAQGANTSLPIIRDYTRERAVLGHNVNRVTVLDATYTTRTLSGAGIDGFSVGIRRGLIIHSTQGWSAVLGSPTGKKLGMRVATLKTLLASAAASRRHLKFVDLRSARSPYVSFR